MNNSPPERHPACTRHDNSSPYPAASLKVGKSRRTAQCSQQESRRNASLRDGGLPAGCYGIRPVAVTVLGSVPVPFLLRVSVTDSLFPLRNIFAAACVCIQACFGALQVSGPAHLQLGPGPGHGHEPVQSTAVAESICCRSGFQSLRWGTRTGLGPGPQCSFIQGCDRFDLSPVKD